MSKNVIFELSRDGNFNLSAIIERNKNSNKFNIYVIELDYDDSRVGDYEDEALNVELEEVLSTLLKWNFYVSSSDIEEIKNIEKHKGAFRSFLGW